MLEAIDLTKTYGRLRAVEALNLTVPPGEVFCLLGANGAGKTTTINLFLGFVEPTSGEARIKGVAVHQDPIGSKRWVGYVPEQVSLYPSLTGLENLAYFVSLALGRRPDTATLSSYLDEVGLPDEAAVRRVGTYSKGMRQKVGVAIALAKGAEALLLDEPTSGLDPKASNEFSALVRGVADRGTAVLMATHDLFRAKELGNRVGIMNGGRLVDTLSTSDVAHVDLERIYLEHMHDGRPQLVGRSA